MGTVIQFKPRVVKAERFDRAADIEAFQLWLAMTMHAVEANATSIVRSITTIETILISTHDNELRGRILGQLESIWQQLTLAVTAVRQLEPLSIEN